jgi:hypothetical protein
MSDHALALPSVVVENGQRPDGARALTLSSEPKHYSVGCGWSGRPPAAMKFHWRCICGIEFIVVVRNPKDMTIAKDACGKGFNAHIQSANAGNSQPASDSSGERQKKEQQQV